MVNVIKIKSAYKCGHIVVFWYKSDRDLTATADVLTAVM